MTKIKRFEQVNESKGIREDGFYWVILKGWGGWTIGKYTGKEGKYCWEIIASDQIFEEDQFEEIGAKIVKGNDKKYTNWQLDSKLEKIVSSNCKEIPYEGTEIDKQGIIDYVKELIYELAPQYKPE